MEGEYLGSKLMKTQSALEYIISHAWMFLVIMIALVVLLALGVFGPATYISTSCSLPAQFSCTVMAFTPNGIVSLSIGQYTHSQITITSIGCSTNQTASYQSAVQQSVNTGNNANVIIQCHSGSATYSGAIGSAYRGYLIVNYTNQASGLSHTITGPVTLKVT